MTSGTRRSRCSRAITTQHHPAPLQQLLPVCLSLGFYARHKKTKTPLRHDQQDPQPGPRELRRGPRTHRDIHFRDSSLRGLHHRRLGNIYTLVVMCHSIRFATSMYISIINLALADLLYLSTIPFVVSTYFLKDWYFGDVGCRILLSLDLLTMHASIFTLTVMCTERYLAVTKPLDTVRRSKSYRKALAWGVWMLSVLLTVPMMVMVTQTTQKAPNGGVKRMCAPTWAPLAYKVYLTVLLERASWHRG
ncbi:hypothetical protein WMY93_010204 [Mugilogobius chulae]|uniref:Urotensin-2 receptor n=1 Tax=Mugilogobius chulae TaxID=88201 RepID=A0AAW0P771_9GOBI